MNGLAALVFFSLTAQSVWGEHDETISLQVKKHLVQALIKAGADLGVKSLRSSVSLAHKALDSTNAWWGNNVPYGSGLVNFITDIGKSSLSTGNEAGELFLKDVKTRLEEVLNKKTKAEKRIGVFDDVLRTPDSLPSAICQCSDDINTILKHLEEIMEKLRKIERKSGIGLR